MARHVLVVLTEHTECGAARMLALHPDAGSAPWRSLQSSLGRALRKLEAEGLVLRFRYSPGDAGWRAYGGDGFTFAHGDRKSIAYHEAGHAVVARVLGRGVKRASIRPPDKETAGHVLFKRLKEPTHDAHTRDVMVSFAGPAAELELYADKTQRRYGYVPRRAIASGARSDHTHVHRAVRDAVSFYDEDGRRVYLPVVAKEVRADMKRKTRALVREHWPQIERVAKALIERETLSGAEIDRLMQQPKETTPPRPARRGAAALAGRGR